MLGIDLGIVFVMLAVLFVVALTFTIVWLRKNNHITANDLKMVSSLLGLSMIVLEEMNLQKEEQILNIGYVIADAVDYATSVAHNGAVNQAAYDYAIRLCVKLNIEVNENRENLIRALIDMTVKEVKHQELLTLNNIKTLD